MLEFIRRLAAAFPRAAQPTGCRAQVCDQHRLPDDEVLRRLEAIGPGFLAWAESVGRARR